MPNSLRIIFKESKIRIWWTFFSFLGCSLLSYNFSEYLLLILLRPFFRISESSSIFMCTQITESLNTYIATSLVFSVFCCAPYLFYQFLCFLIPSCKNAQRSQILKYCLLSIMALVSVFLLTYFLILPNIWHFFYQINFPEINSQNILVIKLQPKIYDFMVLTLRILFITLLLSQLPIFIFYLIENNLISCDYRRPTSPGGSQYNRHALQWNGSPLLARKFFLLLSALLSALITPPDFWCQFIVCLSIYTLVELTFIISFIQLTYSQKKSDFL